MANYHRVSLGATIPADKDEALTEPHSHPNLPGPLTGSGIVLAILLLVHIALISLWSAKTFQSHPFSLDRVSEATQLASVVTQVTITVLLIALVSVVQGGATDRIIRRSQTVAALQDNIDAWKGLGASLVALWRGRRLGNQLWLRILAITAFFMATSILQISTPSIITVGTINATTTVDLIVSTMPGHLTNFNISFATWATDPAPKDIISALPMVWNQTGSGLGTPVGINGSVMFSTLETAQSDALIFEDPYAAQFSVVCSSIPRATGDLYNISLNDGDPNVGLLDANLTVKIRPVLDGTNDTNLVFQGSPVFYFNDGFSVGGETSSRGSPTPFQFDDNVQILSSPEISPPFASFAFLSTRSDALPENATLGIEAPVKIQSVQPVWSWVKNASLTVDEEERHAFRENATLILYAWPIGCSMFVQNVTAKVLGTNQLVNRTPQPPKLDHGALFSRYKPSNALEISWADLFRTIEILEPDTRTSFANGDMPAGWLEKQILSLLNGTSLPSETKLHDSPGTGDRLNAVENLLGRVTGMMYGLIIENYRSQTRDGIPGASSSWTPLLANVTGQQQVQRGVFVINGLQLFIGMMCTLVLIGSVIVALPFGASETEVDSKGIVRDGGVVDLISLVDGSSIPMILASHDLQSTTNAERRAIAERTTVRFHPGRLDTPAEFNMLKNPPFHLSPQATKESQSTDPNLTSTALTSQMPELPYGRAESHARSSRLTLKPYHLAAQVILTALVAFDMIFGVIWVTRTFDNRLWPIERLGMISQLTSILAQAWSIGPLAVLAYMLQKIASNKTIRREQTVAELHDALGALSGLGASTRAVLKELRFMRRVSFDVVIITTFFTAISILHVVVPIVISVDTTTRLIAISSTNAATMPGQVLDLGISAAAGAPPGRVDLPDALNTAIITLRYMYNQRSDSSMGLPRGFNDSTFFSWPYHSLGSEVTLEDHNATTMSIHCGVVPQSQKYNNDLQIAHSPAVTPEEWNTTQIEAIGGFGFDLEDGSPWIANIYIGSLEAQFGDFVTGGPKATKDAPMNVEFKDVLSLATFQNTSMPGTESFGNSPEYGSGTIGLGFLSLRNDTLGLNATLEFEPPITLVVNMTGYSWVNDTTLTMEQQLNTSFKDSRNVTFYFYPLACSLFTSPGIAQVRGDGKFISLQTIADAFETLQDPAKPFLRPTPMTAIEKHFANITMQTYSVYSGDVLNQNMTEFTWMEYEWMDSIANGGGITAVEDSLAYIASLTYALMVEEWRDQLEAANYSAAALESLAPKWVPSNTTLKGTRPVLYARLKVGGVPLLVTLISTLVLIVVTLISIYAHNDAHDDGVVWDGGAIDIMSLMAGSSLPRLIGEGAQEVGGRDGRRVRAERILVSYSTGVLDQPGRLPHGSDKPSSSSKMMEESAPIKLS